MAGKKKVAVRYSAVGRRKSSTARVVLVPGSGKIVVNGKPVDDYMPYATLVMDLKQPLTLTSTVEQFDISVDVIGGGFTGQAGAIRLGIARSLLEASADYRPVLKKAGMLSRDSRAKERKKYGLKAARRAPQFSKR
ncbi:MAG: 30S ribosomal protein S9 [Bacilli bacterium]|jgi:small subunit ribosomal protein S9|nr:30S ribosomal protein S9 [Bacilli bacterium]MDD3422490.1 30S ribosomal protein S9 [Bacilli bacterium]MDD4065942.1 30S ribosomal protein S9 [Bacilli bacterium]